MKRLIATLLTLVILVTNIPYTVFATSHSPRPSDEDDNITGSIIDEDEDITNPGGGGTAHNPLPPDEDDNITGSIVDEEDGSIGSSPFGDDVDITSNYGECLHENTSEKCVEESDYKSSGSTKHSYTAVYETRCNNCGELVESKTKEIKEEHNFKNGECRDCGYIAKDCKHTKTTEKIVYWYTSEDQNGNDTSFTIVNIVCKNCDVKLGEKTYYGPIIAVPDDEDCEHEELETIVEKEWYEVASEKGHYKITKSKVVCKECEKTIKEYKIQSLEYKHTFENGTCTKCLYEEKAKATDTKKETSKEQTPKQNNNQKGSSTKKENQSKENLETKPEEDPIEWIYIDANKNRFAVNGEESIEWDAAPILDANGNLQVPLRQLAEVMGWKVTWNEDEESVTLTNGNVRKVFSKGSDEYVLEENDAVYYEFLQNKVTNRNGVLYVDLDGVLDGTGYSYYVNGTSYHIKSKKDVIEKVVSSQVWGNYEVVASRDVLDEVNYEVEVKSDEILVTLVPGRASYFYTIIVPTANQSLKGNYYDGEVTWAGIAGEIIVGELPIVGQIADVRDIVADIQNWEWSWAHAAQTGIDFIGLIPIIGALKYSDDLMATARKTGKVLDASEAAEIKKILKNGDKVDDATGIGKKALKYSDKYVKAAKKSITCVDDLKALAKDTKIYAQNTIEHIFYGNKKGGMHYKGLKGANGKIKKIVDAKNEFGVYGAEVMVDGKLKYSTFFPDNWTPKQVLDAIDEAFHNGVKNALNQLEYTLESGMKMVVNLDKNGKIISAYPLLK